MPVIHRPSEFSEAQYQSLIESIFRNDFRNGNRFEINFYSGTDERDLGYDMEIKTFIPIFLQMKKSGLYFNGSSNSENEERLNNLHYNDNPGAYYFKLHLDPPTKDYLQHNLLYNLNGKGSYARYIAPLFIEKSALEYLNYNLSPVYWQSPYNRFLMQSRTLHEWRDYFFMEHSIVIKPHRTARKVTREWHKYFFNRRLETSFHSEVERIDEKNIVIWERFMNQLSRSVASLRIREAGNFRSIFENIIKAIQSTFSDVKEWEQNEISIVNSIIERESLNNEFIFCQSFQDMKPTSEYMKILGLYLYERFEVQTILISKIENPINDFY